MKVKIVHRQLRWGMVLCTDEVGEFCTLSGKCCIYQRHCPAFRVN